MTLPWPCIVFADTVCPAPAPFMQSDRSALLLVQVTQRHAFKTLQVSDEQCLCREGGAGNVWARGYKLAQAAPQVHTSVFASEADSGTLLDEALEGTPSSE